MKTLRAVGAVQRMDSRQKTDVIEESNVETGGMGRVVPIDDDQASTLPQALDDAYLDAAAKGIVSGAPVYSGQVCISTSRRVLVQRGVTDALTANICGFCKSLKAGDPHTDPTANISALISQLPAKNVLSALRDSEAIEEGTQLFVGDVSRDGSVIHICSLALNRVRSCVLVMNGIQLSIITLDTIDEAAELSDYTLYSSLWTTGRWIWVLQIDSHLVFEQVKSMKFSSLTVDEAQVMSTLTGP
ncbi:hypothetical protein EV421DRAFT_1904303 [Armillaria borealis]|uniref:Aldehyde dehydrogenase domain-containing protein n=1 Tax=Armillaria borealis TaxID=47425 RepID=A0AA39MPB8_9AGAR|nr:hypothetical protein EV421DRAFT_1904303 [Armillaria borealis]